MPWYLPYAPPPAKASHSHSEKSTGHSQTEKSASHGLSFVSHTSDPLDKFEERTKELEGLVDSLSSKLQLLESVADGRAPFSTQRDSKSDSKSSVADLVYYWDESGPECQGPILLLQSTGLKFHERKFSLTSAREHQNRTDPDNVKHNYNHSLPTLYDQHAKFSVFESHSILRYLAEKFFPNSHWYPSDLKSRTRVNNYLDWHAFTIRTSFMTIGLAYLPGYTRTGVDKSKSYVQLAQDVFYGSSNPLWKDRADNGLINQIQIINDKWLKDSKFLAGDEVSIADLSLYGDAGYLLHLFAIDFNKYPNVKRWYGAMEQQFGQLPARKIYIPIMKHFGGLFKDVFPSQSKSTSSTSSGSSTSSSGSSSTPPPSKPGKKVINYGDDEDSEQTPITTSKPANIGFTSPSKIVDHTDREYTPTRPSRPENKKEENSKKGTSEVSQEVSQEERDGQSASYNDARHWDESLETDLPDLD